MDTSLWLQTEINSIFLSKIRACNAVLWPGKFGIFFPPACPPSLSTWSRTVWAERVITDCAISRLAGFRQYDQEGVKKHAN